MAKFNVTQKRKRAKIAQDKRAKHGDPATGKLKIKAQPVSLSGKQKRKIFKKWRREQKDAVQKGLISMEDIEMAVAEGTSHDTNNNSQDTSKKSPMKFRMKKGGRLRIKKLKAKGNSKRSVAEPAAVAPVDAMVE